MKYFIRTNSRADFNSLNHKLSALHGEVSIVGVSYDQNFFVADIINDNKKVVNKIASFTEVFDFKSEKEYYKGRDDKTN